jgi:hypothetical protein
LLAVYHTGLYHKVTSTWTAITGATFTTNKKADFAHFPLTGKTYITNGTDAVVKYTSGASADQSDTNFKKGTYIVHYKNRLLTSIDNVIWYTDLGVDTFSANNYLKCEGSVTGMEVLYDKWLTFTKKKVYVTQNFSFNGYAAGPESFIPLRTDFGAIYDRTIANVNNLCYFLGQDSEGLCAVYATDGLNVVIVSDKISPDLNALASAQLVNACAAPYGKYYRLSVTPSGQTTNTKEYLYDTVEKRWLPPYTNQVGGFSCYANFETSGSLDTYAGGQTAGRIYKLNQVDYDEDTAGVKLAIDGYADTKAFYFSPQGQEAHLRETFVTANAAGSYNIQVGLNTGTFGGFDYLDCPLTNNGPVYGSTFVFGSSVLGGKQRSENKLTWSGKRGRTFKHRFRNQYSEQPFTVYGYRTRHEILNRFK